MHLLHRTISTHKTAQHASSSSRHTGARKPYAKQRAPMPFFACQPASYFASKLSCHPPSTNPSGAHFHETTTTTTTAPVSVLSFHPMKGLVVLANGKQSPSLSLLLFLGGYSACWERGSFSSAKYQPRRFVK